MARRSALRDQLRMPFSRSSTSRAIRTILNNEVFLVSQMEATRKTSRTIRRALDQHWAQHRHRRLRPGHAPDAGHQSYSRASTTLENTTMGASSSRGRSSRSMGSDRGSFTRAITSNWQGITRNLRNDINRQLYSDGSGAVAVLTATASSNTFTLLTPTSARRRPGDDRHVHRHRFCGQPAVVCCRSQGHGVQPDGGRRLRRRCGGDHGVVTVYYRASSGGVAGVRRHCRR